MWNSLELAKLVVSALTPLLVVGLGAIVTRALRRIEDTQWQNRKVIERRLILYDKMAPLLNDLLCFFLTIGHFREIDPPAALAKKRELDRLFYANEYLMSEHFASSFNAFIQVCFRHYAGVGHDAQLRMSLEDARSERGAARWDEAWNDYFAGGRYLSERESVSTRYRELMLVFSEQVGVRSAA